MEIILLDNIKELGKIGSKITVKSGYARNFLIPKSKAMLATTKNIEIFKEKQLAFQAIITKKQMQAELQAKAISDIKQITIKSKSNIKGKLFGSIGSKIIAKTITEIVGFRVLRSQIRLPKHEILRSTGVYTIKVHLYDKIFSNLKIMIVNELS